jgi:hypothetical protein
MLQKIEHEGSREPASRAALAQKCPYPLLLVLFQTVPALNHTFALLGFETT